MGQRTRKTAKERRSFFEEIDSIAERQHQLCAEGGFPICIREAILDMFGTAGTWRLMSISKTGNFARDLAMKPMTASDYYEQHMNTWRRVLGEEITELIELKAFQKMEFLRCQNCVLFKKWGERIGSPLLPKSGLVQ